MRYQKEVSPKSLKKREKCDKWTEYEGPELLTYLTIEELNYENGMLRKLNRHLY